MKTAPRVPPALYVYIAGVWSLSLAAIGLAIRADPIVPAASTNDVLAALALAIFVAISGAMPIVLSPTVKIHVGTAPLFAATLLFPVPVAVCIGLLGTVAYHAYLQARHRRTWQDLAFNSGRTVLQITLAGLLFHLLGGSRGLLAVTATASPVLAAGLAALVYYVVNVSAVYGATAILTSRSPFRLWWRSVRVEGPQQAALLLFGMVTAIVAGLFPILGLAMVFPVCVVYYSLRGSMSLRAHTQSAVEAIADAVDMRAFGTSGHSRRVAELSARLAVRLGLSGDEVELVRRAARVHDIGKVGFSDSVLRHQTAGRPEQLADLRMHPVFGAEILAPFPEYQRCRQLVRLHHERPDGTGFPEGRHGQQIPLGAAIIAVAETFDALTADRPYRNAIGQAQACAYLKSAAGTGWHAGVVQALLDEVEAKDRAGAAVPVPSRTVAHP